MLPDATVHSAREVLRSLRSAAADDWCAHGGGEEESQNAHDAHDCAIGIRTAGYSAFRPKQQRGVSLGRRLLAPARASESRAEHAPPGTRDGTERGATFR